MAGRYPTLRVAAVMMVVLAITLQPTVAEMTEEEVVAAREEALAKLEKPLEKTPVKELLAMLEERGVECKDCKGAEKAVIVAQVKEAIHLPKKEKAAPKDKKKESEDGKKAKDKKKKSEDEKKAEEEEPAPAEMTEEEVAAAREAALAKLEKPLEKTPVKELLAMLEERGVECKDCKGAEKAVIVAQVKEAIHLPKKEKKAAPKDKKKESEDGKKAKDKKKKSEDEKKAEEEEPAPAEMTEEEVAAAREAALAKLEKPLEKTPVKELLAMLEERGVECKDCKGAEKRVIVAQVKEAIHLPKKAKKAARKRDKKEKKDDDVDDIMSKLKGMPGMENMKVFGRDDLEKMMKDEGKYDL